MKVFRKIVITPPMPADFHPAAITTLFENGIDTVHLRYPDIGIAQMESIIKAIPESLHRNLRIHSHFELVDRYRLAGPHLNNRHPIYHGTTGTLSRSCHSIEQLAGAELYEYSTLSPIFDSISKKGYCSRFTINELKGTIAGKNVVALGGVTPAAFLQLAEAGFAGAAMSGYIWENITTSANVTEQIKELCYNL